MVGFWWVNGASLWRPVKHHFVLRLGQGTGFDLRDGYIRESEHTTSIAYFREKNNPYEAYDGNVKHIVAGKREAV